MRSRGLPPLVAALLGLLLAALLAVATPASAAMPSTAGLGARGGVVVQDVATGRTLLDRRGGVARIPASVTKLFTFGTALLRLGPTWTPRTRVVATGAADGTTWDGDVYLVGGGDPTLTGASVTGLARKAAAALGTTSIRGRVAADVSAFDDWQGGDRTHRAPDYDMGGRLGALTVDRGSRTTSPAARAASLFRSALRSAGVTATAKPTVAAAPDGARTVAAVDGPTLAQLAQAALLPSDNFYAETILKDIASPDGAEDACRIEAGLPALPDPLTTPTAEDAACAQKGAAAGSSTTAAAARLERTTLKPLLGITPKLYDGSGLTRRNRVSPATVTRLLLRLNENPAVAPTLRAALPEAGSSGTLSGRMRGTAAQGRCQAKTGTINGVSSLAGFCHTVAGRDVVFAILQNGVGASSGHAFQDRFVARLAAKG